MPNLINSDLGQNYRRVATGGSNYGTRRIQFYQVSVYGLSDAEVAKLDDYRLVNNTEIDIDQEPEREFKQATIAEAVIRAIQRNGEVYIVGAHDVDNNDPDDNDFYIIIGIAGDTYSSGYEMDERDPEGTWQNNNPYLREALEDVLNAYSYNDFDVYPTFIYGDHWSTINYPNALSRAERKAAKLGNPG